MFSVAKTNTAGIEVTFAVKDYLSLFSNTTYCYHTSRHLFFFCLFCLCVQRLFIFSKLCHLATAAISIVLLLQGCTLSHSSGPAQMGQLVHMILLSEWATGWGLWLWWWWWVLTATDPNILHVLLCWRLLGSFDVNSAGEPSLTSKTRWCKISLNWKNWTKLELLIFTSGFYHVLPPCPKFQQMVCW